MKKNLSQELRDSKTKVVSSIADAHKILGIAAECKEPVFELLINNHWYPAPVSVRKVQAWTGDEILLFTVNGKIGVNNHNERVVIGSWDFINDLDEHVSKSLEDLFKGKRLRFASDESLEAAAKKQLKYNKVMESAGKAFDITTSALVFDERWYKFFPVVLGTPEAPTMSILENSLELRQEEDYEDDEQWRFPFVRLFSLEHKDYVYADVDSLVLHKYAKGDQKKIVLPEKMKPAIDAIFNAKPTEVFGDVFHKRHGGLVVLANGPSGVGKTLTAEVFAEQQERPLYILEMSEVGTSLDQVEANLKTIFARAKKWNAVLLFDEADVFLAERKTSDLERSAIVGVFLRLLDHYEGTFFLTTNRGKDMDTAFKSRVTLYLDYPELTTEIRTKIWENLLEASELKVEPDSTYSMQDVASKPFNGRQIRNQVRLLKLMYPDGVVKTSQVMDSLEFIAQ